MSRNILYRIIKDNNMQPITLLPTIRVYKAIPIHLLQSLLLHNGLCYQNAASDWLLTLFFIQQYPHNNTTCIVLLWGQFIG